jgi:hypothetical protein
MEETTPLDLQIRTDNLEDDLSDLTRIVVCGELHKHGYDFADTMIITILFLQAFLTDAAPASHELVQRLTVDCSGKILAGKSHVKSEQIQIDSREAIS